MRVFLSSIQIKFFLREQTQIVFLDIFGKKIIRYLTFIFIHYKTKN
jgi:hypothetical protein